MKGMFETVLYRFLVSLPADVPLLCLLGWHRLAEADGSATPFTVAAEANEYSAASAGQSDRGDTRNDDSASLQATLVRVYLDHHSAFEQVLENGHAMLLAQCHQTAALCEESL